MMRNVCDYQLRNGKDASLHCKLLDNGEGWCGYQYLCRETGKFENTSGCVSCLVKQKHEAPVVEEVKEEAKLEKEAEPAPVKSTKKKSSYKQNVVVKEETEKE